MKRRTVVTTIGASLVPVALAGCSESNDNDNAGGGQAADTTDEPTATATDAATDTTTETETPTETETDTPTETPTETGTEQPAIKILEHDWEKTEEYDSDAVEDDYGVVGRGVNQTDQRLDVFLEVRFYDEADTQIDSSNASQSGVEGGGKFSFEAPFLGDDPDEVARYEIGWEAYEA